MIRCGIQLLCTFSLRGRLDSLWCLLFLSLLDKDVVYHAVMGGLADLWIISRKKIDIERCMY
ncbi:MAG: hypothetical protein AYK18_15480 [Theionarchaea archaeon DG-70]|nr:MAG: hypothetical protein AYK18_15480 [Theionarchaea archaeon DG-70]